MRIVHLVRHASHAELGQVLSGRSEIALDARGRDEAEALARWFVPGSLRSIWSSPRRRACETAAPVAMRLGLEVRAAEALDEIDFGAFAGRSFDALGGDTDWQRWNAARGVARCPGGETMAEAVARATAFLGTIPAEATPVLCVTHCDIIRGVVARLLGLGYERMFALGCDPASMTTLEIAGGDWRLRSLNLPSGSSSPPPAPSRAAG